MDRIIKTKARLQYNCNFRGKRICPSGETEIRGVATSCEYLDAPPAVTNITPPKNGGLVCYTTMGSKYCAARYVDSGGSRIYRRVASTSWGGGADYRGGYVSNILYVETKESGVGVVR